MREIKFRAWLKKENKMVEVKSLHLGTRKIIYGYSETSQCYGNKGCSFDDIELMQCTDIKDRNGKEIYEGDILFYKFKSYLSGEDRGAYYIVKYEDGMFCIYIKEYNEKEGKEEWIEDDRLCKSLIEVDKLEVIGNIYENPELLEVE